MNIFKAKENKVSYETYLKCKSILNYANWGFSIESEAEMIIAQGVCDEYKKQNKYNLFRRINEKYRPFIKYGKISRFLEIYFWLSFISYIAYILYTMILFGSGSKSDLAFGIVIFITMNFLITFFFFMSYRDKYEKEEKKYKRNKEKPDWKRKEILKKLVK